MYEFCTKHGEGKKWYLQMKNYAEELLHEELSAAQKGIVGATTRFEWNNPQSQTKFHSKSRTFFHSCKTKNIRTFLLPS